MFLLPAFVIYIYFEHPSISFYIISFIMTILIPIIPTVISSILGYLVKLVSSKFKSKKIIQTILSSIIFMGIFFLSFNLNNFIEDIAGKASSINDMLTRIYYPVGAYTTLIDKFDIMVFIKLLLMNIIPFILFILLGGKYYFKIISNSKESIVRKIDLAILDVMMPEIDGFKLCSIIRKKYNFPIIFATARVEDIDKINGLSIGADDYVTKPFEPLELMARVKAQLRRYQKYNNVKEENIIDFRGIVINNDTHEFIFNNERVELTKTEFAILWLLCENRGNVVKSDVLFSSVWKENYFEKDNNTIMVHIRHIREKMKDTYSKPKYIKTIYGVGYKIEK